MSDLSTFIIQFDKELESREIVCFRGAVIASLKQKNILFHNHTEDNYRYSYPLIQYKTIHRKAAIVCIGDGLEGVNELLASNNFIYNIGKKEMEMRIESVNAHNNHIQIDNGQDFRYRLRNWLPLNSKNYEQFMSSDNLIERISILERVLTGNILSFLKGIGLYLEEQINLHITDITAQRAVTYKKVKLMAFDIEFKANIQLPQYIGIGKNASVGCGVLTKITN